MTEISEVRDCFSVNIAGEMTKLFCIKAKLYQYNYKGG